MALGKTISTTSAEAIESDLKDYTSILWLHLTRTIERDLIIKLRLPGEKSQRNEAENSILKVQMSETLKDIERLRLHCQEASLRDRIYADIQRNQHEKIASLVRVFIRRSPEDLDRIAKICQFFRDAVAANEWTGPDFEAMQQRHVLAMMLYPVLFDQRELEAQCGITRGQPLADEEHVMIQRRGEVINSAMALAMEFIAVNWDSLLLALKRIRTEI